MLTPKSFPTCKSRWAGVPLWPWPPTPHLPTALGCRHPHSTAIPTRQHCTNPFPASCKGTRAWWVLLEGLWLHKGTPSPSVPS